MKLTIQNWDNCAAIKLPAAMLKHLGVKIGDTIELNVHSGSTILRIAKPKYRLEDLLAQMPNGLPLVDNWDKILPVGKEL